MAAVSAASVRTLDAAERCPLATAATTTRVFQKRTAVARGPREQPYRLAFQRELSVSTPPPAFMAVVEPTRTAPSTPAGNAGSAKRLRTARATDVTSFSALTRPILVRATRNAKTAAIFFSACRKRITKAATALGPRPCTRDCIAVYSPVWRCTNGATNPVTDKAPCLGSFTTPIRLRRSWPLSVIRFEAPADGGERLRRHGRP